LLKTETTQKVDLVKPQNTHQDLLASEALAATTAVRSRLVRIAALFRSRLHQTSAVAMGLTVLMGMLNFPTNAVDNVAVAAESALNSTEALSHPETSVEQLRSDVSGMRLKHGSPKSVLVAQAASFQPAATNSTAPNGLQFTGEISVPIEVAQPKARAVKSVPTGQAYYGNNAPESESREYEDRSPVTPTTGTTTIGFSWPAAGKLTSRYGRRWGRMHKGIDIAGPIGTPINAAADGMVIASGWNSGGYGNLVEVRHNDGTITRYGHNSRLSVTVGQTVRQGQQVAEMGSTGHSTGSHLHFEIRPTGGNAVNPIALLPSNS
jgi:murein DD-endopeptidase MepM/ murein hydrolase activator NlpD